MTSTAQASIPEESTCALFSLRVFYIDHYLSASPQVVRLADVPGEPMEISLRAIGSTSVPVIRIFGSTPRGQKACLHLHGSLPYFYLLVPRNLGLSRESAEAKVFVEQFLTQLEIRLQRILYRRPKSSKPNASKETPVATAAAAAPPPIQPPRRATIVRYVARVGLCNAIQFYGYHDHQDLFLRVELFDPKHVFRAAEECRTGHILNQRFRVFESHIGYYMKLFVDYGFSGMSCVNLSSVKFRRSLPAHPPDKLRDFARTGKPLGNPATQNNTPTIATQNGKASYMLNSTGTNTLTQLEALQRVSPTVWLQSNTATEHICQQTAMHTDMTGNSPESWLEDDPLVMYPNRTSSCELELDAHVSQIILPPRMHAAAASGVSTIPKVSSGPGQPSLVPSAEQFPVKKVWSLIAWWEEEHLRRAKANGHDPLSPDDSRVAHSQWLPPKTPSQQQQRQRPSLREEDERRKEMRQRLCKYTTWKRRVLDQQKDKEQQQAISQSETWISQATPATGDVVEGLVEMLDQQHESDNNSECVDEDEEGWYNDVLLNASQAPDEDLLRVDEDTHRDPQSQNERHSKVAEYIDGADGIQDMASSSDEEDDERPSGNTSKPDANTAGWWHDLQSTQADMMRDSIHESVPDIEDIASQHIPQFDGPSDPVMIVCDGTESEGTVQEGNDSDTEEEVHSIDEGEVPTQVEVSNGESEHIGDQSSSWTPTVPSPATVLLLQQSTFPEQHLAPSLQQASQNMKNVDVISNNVVSESSQTTVIEADQLVCGTRIEQPDTELRLSPRPSHLSEVQVPQVGLVPLSLRTALPPQDPLAISKQTKSSLPQGAHPTDRFAPDNPLSQPMHLSEQQTEDVLPDNQLSQPMHLSEQQTEDVLPDNQLSQPMHLSEQLTEDVLPDNPLSQPMHLSEQQTEDVLPDNQLSQPMHLSEQQTEDVLPDNQLSQPMHLSEQQTEDVLPDNQLSQPMHLSEQQTEDVLPDNQLSQPMHLSEQQTEDALPNNQPPQDVTPKEQLTEGALPNNQPPQDVTPKEQLTEGVLPNNQPPQDVTPKEQLTKNVLPNNQRPRDVTPKEQLTEGVLQAAQPQLGEECTSLQGDTQPGKASPRGSSNQAVQTTQQLLAEVDTQCSSPVRNKPSSIGMTATIQRPHFPSQVSLKSLASTRSENASGPSLPFSPTSIGNPFIHTDWSSNRSVASGEDTSMKRSPLSHLPSHRAVQVMRLRGTPPPVNTVRSTFQNRRLHITPFYGDSKDVPLRPPQSALVGKQDKNFKMPKSNTGADLREFKPFETPEPTPERRGMNTSRFSRDNRTVWLERCELPPSSSTVCRHVANALTSTAAPGSVPKHITELVSESATPNSPGTIVKVNVRESQRSHAVVAASQLEIVTKTPRSTPKKRYPKYVDQIPLKRVRTDNVSLSRNVLDGIAVSNTSGMPITLDSFPGRKSKLVVKAQHRESGNNDINTKGSVVLQDFKSEMMPPDSNGTSTSNDSNGPSTPNDSNGPSTSNDPNGPSTSIDPNGTSTSNDPNGPSTSNDSKHQTSLIDSTDPLAIDSKGSSTSNNSNYKATCSVNTANKAMNETDSAERAPTPLNSANYGFAHESVEANRENQHFTSICVEVLGRSRSHKTHASALGDRAGMPWSLLPDPQDDPVDAIVYVIRDDDSDVEAFRAKQGANAGEGSRGMGDRVGVIYVNGSILVTEADETKIGADQDDVMRSFLDGSVPLKKPEADLNGISHPRINPYPVVVRSAKDEVELFLIFSNLIRNLDPDLIFAYELQNSSIGYLLDRAKVLGIPLPRALSRTPWGTQDPRNGNDDWGSRSQSGIWIPGRIILNVWRFLRHEEKLPIYTLEKVAHALLRRRLPQYSSGILSGWFADPKSRWRALRHLADRAVTTLAILDHLDAIGRTSELARFFGMDFFSVLTRGSQFRVESVLIRVAKPLGYLLASPSRKDVASQPGMEEIALIFEPRSRRLKYKARKFQSKQSTKYSKEKINSPDGSVRKSQSSTKSLYASKDIDELDSSNYNDDDREEFNSKLGVLNSFYASADALTRFPDLGETATIAHTGAVYVPSSKREGVLPSMLSEILATRIMVKKAMKEVKERGDKVMYRILDARQYGLKMIANVTYGYTAAGFSGRMPCSDLSDSIVRLGRESLKSAADMIQSNKDWAPAEVVYGDTDSVFVHLPGRSLQDAFQIGKDISRVISAQHPDPVELQFEKVYMPCMLVTKKRYVGMRYETMAEIASGTPHFEAKGIETVRRDSCYVVSKLMESCLRIVFMKKDLSLVKSYLLSQLRKILEDRISVTEFVLASKVRLGSYSTRKGSTMPPSAIVASRMMLKDARRKPLFKQRIPYVVVNGDPGSRLVDLVVHPYEFYHPSSQLKINAEYYITKKILPALDRLFGLVGADVKDWYQNMSRPRARALDRHGPRLRGTNRSNQNRIDQYLKNRRCIICEDATLEAVCPKCSEDPQQAQVALEWRHRQSEQRVFKLSRLCLFCSRGCESGVSSGHSIEAGDPRVCVSVDCIVYHERKKAWDIERMFKQEEG